MDPKRSEIYRCREIMAMGEARGMIKEATKAIADGTSIEDFRGFLLSKMPVMQPVGQTPPELGLSESETRQFSLVNLILHMSRPNDLALERATGMEREISTEYAKLTKRTPRGILIPPEVLKRDLTVGVDSAGGYTVGTDIRPQNFIEALRNKAIIFEAGATELTDLVGDVSIPKQSSAATAYWIAESASPTESQQTFGQLALSPKTVGALIEVSRKLLVQSSVAVESFVRNDLARVLAIAIDTAALHGTGSANQPTGIAATSGIGSVAGGTNGAAPDLADIIALETEVAQDNADVGGNMGYITNVKVRGKLKNTLVTPTYGDRMVYDVRTPEKPLNGHKCHISNSVSSGLTKGTANGICSAIFYGNWTDLVIAFWSGLDLLVDPYTHSASGAIRVTGFQDIDIGVRHPESFAAMLDVLTS